MNCQQKIDALTDLLSDVIFTLDMKQFSIDDPSESHQCEVEADQFHQQMINILHSRTNND
jgi:hypothetical protein